MRQPWRETTEGQPATDQQWPRAGSPYTRRIRPLITQEYSQLQEARLREGFEAELDKRSELFKALGDRNRQKILHLLRDGEKSVSEILPHFDILQPTVSTHLLLLEEAGLLKVRRDGRRRLYSISDYRIYEAMDSFVEDVSGLVGA